MGSHPGRMSNLLPADDDDEEEEQEEEEEEGREPALTRPSLLAKATTARRGSLRRVLEEQAAPPAHTSTPVVPYDAPRLPIVCGPAVHQGTHLLPPLPSPPSSPSQERDQPERCAERAIRRRASLLHSTASSPPPPPDIILHSCIPPQASLMHQLSDTFGQHVRELEETNSRRREALAGELDDGRASFASLQSALVPGSACNQQLDMLVAARAMGTLGGGGVAAAARTPAARPSYSLGVLALDNPLRRLAMYNSSPSRTLPKPAPVCGKRCTRLAVSLQARAASS